MNLVAIIKILNDLKRRKKIRDYAIFGAVGASFYVEPTYTKDIDIIVLADTDQDYVEAWKELRNHATRIKDFGFIIADTEVQILPTSVSPLLRSALINARVIRRGEITTKVVDKEHLILLTLKANRLKDRFRASMLLEQANTSRLNSLLRRFDTDGALKERLKGLC